MKEHSQIDDMRAAVRGDIERAKRRRSSPVVQLEPDPVPAPEPDRAPERKAQRQSRLFAFFRKR